MTGLVISHAGTAATIRKHKAAARNRYMRDLVISHAETVVIIRKLSHAARNRCLRGQVFRDVETPAIIQRHRLVAEEKFLQERLTVITENLFLNNRMLIYFYFSQFYGNHFLNRSPYCI